MTTAVQRRRGTTTEHASFTGLEGEISVNTTKETLVVHDGSTAGGFELARADGSNFVASTVDINGGTIDGTVIGGTTPAAVTTSSLVATTADINSGTIDGTAIGASSASTGAFTTLTASGEITANGGIALGDNDKATFGAGDDLQIYHDGSNSYIHETGTGSLKILGQGRITLQNSAGDKTLADFLTNDRVDLYYDNSVKFATTATGIDVTGTATMDGLVVNGVAKVLGTASNTLIIADATETNGYQLKSNTSASTDYGFLIENLAGKDLFRVESNGDISFYEDTGTTAKMVWDASQEALIVGGELKLRYTGSASLIDGGDTLRLRATNDVKIQNFNSTETMAQFIPAGAATLYYANSPKLSTTSTGIDVTGTATMDGLTVEGNGALFTLDNGSNAATLSNTNGNVVLDYDAAEAGRSFTVQQNGRKSLRVNNSGDVSFYEDTGTTPKLFWDASAESLGIGESSPQRALHVNAGSTDIVALLQSDTNAYLSFWDSVGGVKLGSESGSMVFYEGSNSTGAGGAEAMRIDSSGNLLVGKTSTAVSSDGIEARNNGLLVATRDSNKVAILNRRGSDGDILEFMKDTVAVGSIGSNSGTRTYLVLDPRTAYKGAGITGSSIDANTSNIIPTDKNGTIADGDINLGYASSRWKNLYLSGGVYLGGTGDANKLDDYEEGTWTPVASNYSGTMTINRATYEKIGRQITVRASVSFDGTADGSNAIIAGLPFSIPDSDGGAAGMIGRDTSGNCVLVDHQSSASIQFLNASSVGISYSTIGANTIEFTHIYYGS